MISPQLLFQYLPYLDMTYKIHNILITESSMMDADTNILCQVTMMTTVFMNGFSGKKMPCFVTMSCHGSSRNHALTRTIKYPCRDSLSCKHHFDALLMSQLIIYVED